MTGDALVPGVPDGVRACYKCKKSVRYGIDNCPHCGAELILRTWHRTVMTDDGISFEMRADPPAPGEEGWELLTEAPILDMPADDDPDF